MYVAGRLVEAASRLDYPVELLEIQVLDDSDDETVRLVEEQVAQHRTNGLDIHHIRRQHRTGFKAGALAEGLSLAKGEFLAVFDADFLPLRFFSGEPCPISRIQAWDSSRRAGGIPTRIIHCSPCCSPWQLMHTS